MKRTGANFMDNIALLLSPLAIILVFIVLCFGLWNMLKGNNPNLSQKHIFNICLKTLQNR